MGTLDKGTIYVPGGTEEDGSRFHHAAENGAQFKTYESFLSGLLHLMFLDCG